MKPNRIMLVMMILLVLVVGTAVYGHRYLNKSSQLLQQSIDKVEDNTKAGRWEEAKKELASIQENWSTIQKPWTILLDHMEIDNIDTSLSRMEKLLETGNTPLTLAEAATLRQYVKHIPDKEAFNLKNIF